jgi:hypothetical protein
MSLRVAPKVRQHHRTHVHMSVMLHWRKAPMELEQPIHDGDIADG